MSLIWAPTSNLAKQKMTKKVFFEEKIGLVPSTEWKKNALGRGWVLGETLITGIGQGYIQTTPLQLCLMTAQIANGGFEIKPRIIFNEKNNNLREYSQIDINGEVTVTGIGNVIKIWSSKMWKKIQDDADHEFANINEVKG